MLPDNNPTAKVKLDSYSILICSKYFKEETDFVNLVCVCKKFKETTEKLRFNPISVNSLKLFPKIQTQLLYTEDDTMIEGIDNYEILYEVSYDQYLNFRQNNIKCHYVVYTKENSQQFGDNVLVGVNMLGDKCFSYHSSLLKINIPSTIISLGRKCFGYHRSLQSITLPSSLKSLNDECFIGCFFINFH
ncbi:Leucine rich repeat protein bspa family [Entamoeba marina]